MNGPRDQRFAGAAFAGDQHRGLGVGDAVDHVEDLEHAMIVADHVLHAEAQIELGLELLVFFDHLALLRARSDGHSSSSSISGLVRKSNAPANRLDRRLDRAVAGDQDDGRPRLISRQWASRSKPSPSPKRMSTSTRS